jgi:NAD(P)-dependent dehydrogenase (short-subunit alcohol dehydrogenase family)
VKRVLVAGATVYLGRFVAKEFEGRGDCVRVLARNLDKLKMPGQFLETALTDLVDDKFVGEVSRPETLRGCSSGSRFSSLPTGSPGRRTNFSCMDVDYRGNKHLLERSTISWPRTSGRTR